MFGIFGSLVEGEEGFEVPFKIPLGLRAQFLLNDY